MKKDTSTNNLPINLDRSWRDHLYAIIFESDTAAGRRFDSILLVIICLSVATVIIDSVASVRAKDFLILNALEWLFTLFFTIEYILRLLCVKQPLRYALSWLGIVDLIAILPTYLAIIFPEFHFLIDIRLLRMFRMFRILKIPLYLHESHILWSALKSSRHKIYVFLGAVVIMSVILSTIMYVVEGPENGFTSIPLGMYWSIVTLTTTGYGDIRPHTPLGQLITSCVMLIGYGVIALPTGIIGVELAMAIIKGSGRICISCTAEGHETNATYCKNCGEKLASDQNGSAKNI
ncbi:MAG: Potassium voltage-gated channel subfamily [Solimicrobium sp.]|jgi:voltage-gated potassium channel|nr:Potassium voltage-gated channel subfamily [Solimicrobium sp.]